jgi:S1-C subfamily serine protease
MNRPERTFTTDQIRLERRLPSYWRVTFDMPPVNIFGPKQLPLLGDIITEIEGQPATNPNQLAALTLTKKPGETVKLRYARAENTADAVVTLGAHP